MLADQADGTVRAGRDRGPGQCRVPGVLVHHRRAAGQDDGVVVESGAIVAVGEAGQGDRNGRLAGLA